MGYIRNEFCTIYKITNKINGKSYIGQTWGTLSHRWSRHVSDANNIKLKPYKLGRSIAKYGRDSFIIEQLHVALDQKEADMLEDNNIIKFNTITDGYNLKRGGSQGRLSEESRLKRTRAYLSLETLEKKRIARVNFKHTAESKAKISSSLIASEKMAISAKNQIGRKASLVTRLKMSEAAKKRIRTPEHKANISASKRGHLVSEATRLKISETLKNRHMNNSEIPSVIHATRRRSSADDK